MITKPSLETVLLDLAIEAGAVYPVIADATNGETDSVVILDAASGRTWKIELREFRNDPSLPSSRRLMARS